MSVYHHFQEAKKAEPLPQADKLGMCLNCSFWEAEHDTKLQEKDELALCVLPELKPFAVIVSGTSACNKWKERENVDPQAKAYSQMGEA